jgi:hypothetical protein
MLLVKMLINYQIDLFILIVSPIDNYNIELIVSPTKFSMYVHEPISHEVGSSFSLDKYGISGLGIIVPE